VLAQQSVYFSLLSFVFILGAVQKDVHTRRRRGVSVLTFCGQDGKGGSWHFLVQKTSDFSNLWCVRTDKRGERGEASADILRSEGEGNFSRFCANVLYGRPLSHSYLRLETAKSWKSRATRITQNVDVP